MRLKEAAEIAHKCLTVLKSSCQRIEIGGSIRRKVSEVKDIEIVCIPNAATLSQDSLFDNPMSQKIPSPDFIAAVEQWQPIKGSPHGRYTRRLLPEGIELDIFIANADNWGYILALRTGPWEYSKFLVTRAKRLGYIPFEGHLYYRNALVPVREENDFFDLLNLRYLLPEYRRNPV
jgi:DNA polymerase (family 10)